MVYRVRLIRDNTHREIPERSDFPIKSWRRRVTFKPLSLRLYSNLFKLEKKIIQILPDHFQVGLPSTVEIAKTAMTAITIVSLILK